MASRYNEQQFNDNYPDGMEFHYWNVARNRLVLELISTGRDDVVLDVGCGRGIVVDHLRRHAVNCWGCEVGTPRPATASVAPYLMLGTDVQGVDDSFALTVTHLLFLDVLEHLQDPVSLLISCRSRFRNVERVIITVPARQELWTNYDEWFGHYCRYDLAGLTELVAVLSPSRVKAGYFFRALYPAIRVSRAFGLARTTSMVAPHGRVAQKAHGLLGHTSRLFDKILPSALPGTSIFAAVDL
jgi:hypothetical protein